MDYSLGLIGAGRGADVLGRSSSSGFSEIDSKVRFNAFGCSENFSYFWSRKSGPRACGSAPFSASLSRTRDLPPRMIPIWFGCTSNSVFVLSSTYSVMELSSEGWNSKGTARFFACDSKRCVAITNRPGLHYSFRPHPILTKVNCVDCAIANNGPVGVSTSGRLYTSSYDKPVETGPIRFVRCFAGWGSYFAVDESGDVWACGDNTAGQLGVGDDRPEVETFQHLPRFAWAPIIHIACGEMATYFLAQNDVLFACGSGADGRLLNFNNDNRRFPCQCALTDGRPLGFVGRRGQTTRRRCPGADPGPSAPHRPVPSIFQSPAVLGAK
jgi:hypothetical protein